VLWHCWLGHVTRKTVSEMTYNVSSGTLNSTIPYLGIANQDLEDIKHNVLIKKQRHNSASNTHQPVVGSWSWWTDDISCSQVTRHKVSDNWLDVRQLQYLTNAVRQSKLHVTDSCRQYTDRMHVTVRTILVSVFILFSSCSFLFLYYCSFSCIQNFSFYSVLSK